MSSLANASGHPSWIWRNGEFIAWDKAFIHLNAVGHTTAATVFEGIKAYVSSDGSRLSAFRLDEHLARMYSSARICRLDIPFPPAEIRDACMELLRRNDYREDTYIRPWIFVEGVVRELMVPAGTRCEVAIDSWGFRSGLTAEGGCRAGISSWMRPNDASIPARVKAFSNYHNGRFALLEARENGHDYPILLNDRRKVSEGPSACIGLVRDGQVVTPSLTSDVLGSITVDTVADLALDNDIPMIRREVDRTELYLADELFFMGTGAEVMPITAIDGLAVGDGKPGPMTLRLREAYSALVRGSSANHTDWLTPIDLPRDTGVA
jgi:branched-chain amino acid aminotransferase